jgi:hypothetical protein
VVCAWRASYASSCRESSIIVTSMCFDYLSFERSRDQLSESFKRFTSPVININTVYSIHSPNWCSEPLGRARSVKTLKCAVGRGFSSSGLRPPFAALRWLSSLGYSNTRLRRMSNSSTSRTSTSHFNYSTTIFKYLLFNPTRDKAWLRRKFDNIPRFRKWPACLIDTSAGGAKL